MREELKKAIAEALKGTGVSVAAGDIPLEHPAELKNGDYSTGVALQYAKQAGTSPRALAEKLAEELRSSTALGPTSISKIEVAGPGFINFYLSPRALAASLRKAIEEDRWGANEKEKGKKVLVEYTDPNPFKEFHIGHLMPNVIGESISRLFAFAGADVKRANYQGDIGRHVARAIWGLMRSGESAEDVKALAQAYAAGAAADVDGALAKDEITAINKKIYERSDKKINGLYDAGRTASLEHFEEIYKILGTKFDFYFFESETGPFGKEIVEAHIGDVFEKSDGAVVYPGEKKNLHTRVFLNSEGLPTYEAKELGLSKMKFGKFAYDTSVIVTGNEINEYFRVLIAAMREVFPDLAAKTKHISHGMLRLTEGKMSSRTGNVITGESLIEDLIDVAHGYATDSRADDKEKLAQEVAVAAIKFQILKGATGKDIIFDRKQALSVEGDSGPYLQYAHARANGVVEKAGSEGVPHSPDEHAEPNDLVRLVHRFPEVVEYAVDELEPHLITNYLLALASAFNSWYAQVHILDGTPEAGHKVAIVDAVRKTLKNGLWILGIPAPERM
ncbi:arginine--tRNA ligase [Candidatus Kaiserbacteria bacterium]|nr:arginine--tRNA ligase [Candidatus Kaiserbacteria bacterium]